MQNRPRIRDRRYRTKQHDKLVPMIRRHQVGSGKGMVRQRAQPGSSPSVYLLYGDAWAHLTSTSSHAAVRVTLVPMSGQATPGFSQRSGLRKNLLVTLRFALIV